MTREEAIELLKDKRIEINYKVNGTTQFSEALDIAIRSLEAYGEIRQEINDLFSKPACYMPNYDAYKMFLEIIDKHLREEEE